MGLSLVGMFKENRRMGYGWNLVRRAPLDTRQVVVRMQADVRVERMADWTFQIEGRKLKAQELLWVEGLSG